MKATTRWTHLVLGMGILLTGKPIAFGNASPSNITCEAFAYQGVVFATVRFNLKDDGHVERLGEVEHYGQRHQIALEELQTASGEYLHLLVDADSPGNELRLIVYSADAGQNKYRGLLINDHTPAMREMKAACTAR